MKRPRSLWVVGLGAILLVILVPLIAFWPKAAKAKEDPWANVPTHPTHVEHKDIVTGEFATGQDVTRACLECHAESGEQMIHTTHFTWESQPFDVPWRDELVTIGKANQINNFCIGSQGNEKKCMTCHAGYSWSDENYDFSNPENVDCLACHADTSVYAKGEYGDPAPGIDLLAAAQSVRAPTRDNCGKCHFDGGGGNGVKHGDLDESLYFPSESLDVHMGGLNFLCADCHTTEDHQVKGRMLADNYTIAPEEQVACTDCHSEQPHPDERLNLHTDAGEGGFWTTFDWLSALTLGAQDTGLNFSGQYGFTETWMYWPTTHMVQPKEYALQCDACHSGNGRLDWIALGYPGDPMEWGGR